MLLHEVPRLQVQAAKCLLLKLPVTFLNVIVALPVPFQDRFLGLTGDSLVKEPESPPIA